MWPFFLLFARLSLTFLKNCSKRKRRIQNNAILVTEYSDFYKGEALVIFLLFVFMQNFIFFNPSRMNMRKRDGVYLSLEPRCLLQFLEGMDVLPLLLQHHLDLPVQPVEKDFAPPAVQE